MENMEINAKMEARVAMNTTSDLAYTQQWAYPTFGNFILPMTEDVILLFITDHLQGMEATKEKQLMSPVLRRGYKAKPGLYSLAAEESLTIHFRQ
jgi:hypothetical protein